jgi:hypothetical protein
MESEGMRNGSKDECAHDEHDECHGEKTARIVDGAGLGQLDRRGLDLGGRSSFART